MLNASRRQRRKRRGESNVDLAHDFEEVLNASRRQRRKRSWNAVSNAVVTSMCSTPLGVREGSAPLSNFDRNSATPCSTPLGVREGSAPTAKNRFTALPSCAQRLSASEKEAHHSSPSPLSLRTRAQRLSASEKEARQPLAHGQRFEVACSTPLGVREGSARRMFARA